MREFQQEMVSLTFGVFCVLEKSPGNRVHEVPDACVGLVALGQMYLAAPIMASGNSMIRLTTNIIQYHSSVWDNSSLHPVCRV
jgi:hypothetical protein